MFDSLNILIGLFGYFLVLLDMSGLVRWLGRRLKFYRIRLFENARRVAKPNLYRTTLGNYSTLMITAPFLLLGLLVWIALDVYRLEPFAPPRLVPYLEFAYYLPLITVVIIWIMFWIRYSCARFFAQWKDRSRRHPIQSIFILPVALILNVAMAVLGAYTVVALIIGSVIWLIHIILNFPRRGALAAIGIAIGSLALLLELQYQYY